VNKATLFATAYCLDLIFGDPPYFPHPVRAIGTLITVLDARLRGKGRKWKERIKGVIFSCMIVGVATGTIYFFIEYTIRVNPFLGTLTWIYLSYTALATKGLWKEAESVLKELQKNALVNARRQLSKIVGRDTHNLNREQIITATIESIAENTNDGIIAPLFYLILGGPVLAYTYKAINTLDSMVGYRNEKYLHFGWFSAKLDDFVNYIPARCCALLMVLSAALLKLDYQGALKILFRDGRKHCSPNSGISEAVVAGALGLCLGGVSWYQGEANHKPYIGEPRQRPHLSCIDKALHLSLVSSLLMFSLGIFWIWIR
jgi:adenosylcobinamide-phosphate synthase